MQTDGLDLQEQQKYFDFNVLNQRKRFSRLLINSVFSLSFICFSLSREASSRRDISGFSSGLKSESW